MTTLPTTTPTLVSCPCHSSASVEVVGTAVKAVEAVANSKEEVLVSQLEVADSRTNEVIELTKEYEGKLGDQRVKQAELEAQVEKLKAEKDTILIKYEGPCAMNVTSKGKNAEAVVNEVKKAFEAKIDGLEKKIDGLEEDLLEKQRKIQRLENDKKEIKFKGEQELIGFKMKLTAEVGDAARKQEEHNSKMKDQVSRLKTDHEHEIAQLQQKHTHSVRMMDLQYEELLNRVEAGLKKTRKSFASKVSGLDKLINEVVKEVQEVRVENKLAA